MHVGEAGSLHHELVRAEWHQAKAVQPGIRGPGGLHVLVLVEDKARGDVDTRVDRAGAAGATALFPSFWRRMSVMPSTPCSAKFRCAVVCSRPGISVLWLVGNGAPVSGGNGNTNWLRVLGRPWHGEHYDVPHRMVSTS